MMQHSVAGQIDMEYQQDGYLGANEGWIDYHQNYSPCQSQPLIGFEPQKFNFWQTLPNHYVEQQHPVSCDQRNQGNHSLSQNYHHSLSLNLPGSQAWPSMMISPERYAVPQLSQPKPPVKVTGTRIRGGSPRKTLTDDDRKQMCQYHEKNPTVKQTEIGAIFGVERSTVSKVLRQREKYLCREDSESSPVKRAKGKFPDIDRALSNWVRNRQKLGQSLTDAEIMAKARSFSLTVGNKDNHQKTESTIWLEKFKRKNGVDNIKFKRRNSESLNANKRSDRGSGPASLPSGSSISPISPCPAFSSSPLLAMEEKKNDPECCPDFVETLMPDTTTSFSFSAPDETNWFNSRDSTVNSCGSQRSRSQTSPNLLTNSLYTSTDNFQSSKISLQPPSLAQKPLDQDISPYSIDSIVSSCLLRQDSGASSIVPESTEGYIPLPLPTNEDAQCALKTLIAFLAQAPNNGLLDQNEFLIFVKLFDRIQFQP